MTTELRDPSAHGADAPGFDLSRPRRVHLVGVGGAGMSGVARMLLQRGHEVSGTDLRDSSALAALAAMGAQVRVGHDADAIGSAEVVVVSSAIPPGNAEVAAARARGVAVVHRSEMLAALMAGQQRVLVAGTHGKTTTTSMVVVGLQAGGGDPSFSIGGALNDAGSNGHVGTGDVFVAEADESDRSFLAYRPDLALVTNVELDHPEHFRDLADVQTAFRAFLERRPAGALAVVCADDPGARELAGWAREPVLTYGESPDATARLTVGDDDGAVLRLPGGAEVALRPGVPGRHNLLNAAAAVVACDLLGTDAATAAAGLSSFTGAQRRFQRLGRGAGVEVIDDYAHHATELRATIAAARSLDPARVVVVVQPHRYSRTAALGHALGVAAAAADVVVVTDVYAAGEAPIVGVGGHLVADAARGGTAEVRWVPHLSDLVDELLGVVRDGDLVLITGAGDVSQVGPALLAALQVRDGG